MVLEAVIVLEVVMGMMFSHPWFKNEPFVLFGVVGG